MNSPPASFFDSNVILYAVVNGNKKAEIAAQILKAGGVISVQVLNEVANAGRKKFGLDWAGVHIILDLARAVTRIVPVDEETHEIGLKLAQRYQWSVWDSMIVASAVQAECDTLYSEDMQDGMLIENRLRIVNPFKDAI